MAQGYLIFHLNLAFSSIKIHLNLAFSSIKTEARPDVISKCYWPLLELAEHTGIPIGIELTGWTLQQIALLDQSWVDRFRLMLENHQCELIGSGWTQIIGPLVPYAVNCWNQKLGVEAYRQMLGVTPKLALVNEMAFSTGMVEVYAEAGIYLAGITIVKSAEEMTLSEWNDVLNVNLTGFFEFSRACLPAFKRSGGGHLVVISSIMVTHPYPMRSAYAASKAGLEGLVRSLAVEWGSYNVKVNGLRLGHLNGLMKSTTINPNFLQSVKSRTPNHNLVNPEAVGKYIEWLLLGSGSCISGSIIDFDPAYTINRWPLVD